MTSPVKDILCLGHLNHPLLQLVDGEALVLIHVEQIPHLPEYKITNVVTCNANSNCHYDMYKMPT